MTPRIFIFGAGYSGKAFAAARSDPAIEIAGTTRSPEKFDGLRHAGITPFAFDGGSISEEMAERLRRATHLVVSIAPEEAGDPVLAVARQTIAGQMPDLRWIGYLSTVGVYGDHGGGWVDETSECRPVSRRSVMRVAAEREWLALGEETGLPVAILRLSGIYGPGRNAFVNLANGTAKRLVKQGQVFNRIHVADIAGALWHLGGRDQGRRLQRHGRPPRAAAGRRRLRGRPDGRRAAARNFFRHRPTFAHGAVLLWREQAGFQRRYQAGRLPVPLSGLPARLRRHVGRAGLGRGRRGGCPQPDEAGVIEAGGGT